MREEREDMNYTNYKRWTPEQVAEYIERWKTLSGDEVARIYNVSRRAITYINKQFGLRKLSKDFEKKEQPPKIRKKRSDASPIGSIVGQSKKGVLKHFIHTPEGRMRLHKYNWLQAGNTIPEGYVLAFKEIKTPEDCSVENLELKTKGQVVVKYRKPAHLWKKRVKKGRTPKPRIKPVKEAEKPVKLFATSEKIAVRINAKLTIMIPRGADINKIVKKYKTA